MKSLKEIYDSQNVYYRATNNVDERDICHKINSRNQITGNLEGGLSVSDSLIFAQTYNYKYVYKVKGKLVGKGSDGEPIISNPIPVSKLYLTTKLVDYLE